MAATYQEATGKKPSDGFDQSLLELTSSPPNQQEQHYGHPIRCAADQGNNTNCDNNEAATPTNATAPKNRFQSPKPKAPPLLVMPCQRASLRASAGKFRLQMQKESETFNRKLQSFVESLSLTTGFDFLDISVGTKANNDYYNEDIYDNRIKNYKDDEFYDGNGLENDTNDDNDNFAFKDEEQEQFDDRTNEETEQTKPKQQ